MNHVAEHTQCLKRFLLPNPKDERHFEEARVFENGPKIIFIITLLKYQDGGYTVKCSGHYMYRTVVTICTIQWSLYVPYSGHYMYRTVVTICTTILTLNKYYVLPTHCIYVFCVYLRTNSGYLPIQH